MNRFTFVHEIACAPDDFWNAFFDRNFAERHYLEGIGFSEFRIVEQRETPDRLERKVEAMPQVKMPKAVARLFGSGFRYVEDGVFDKTSRVFGYRTVPNALADKIRNEGSMRVEAIGPARVRRIIELSIDVRVLGLGGVMENLAEKTLHEGWEASARFTNQWFAGLKHPRSAVS